MSLLAWNCRGLAKLRAVRFLKETINQFRPSIVFLSETLVKNNKIAEICKKIGFAGYHAVDVQGHGGGLALFWKNEGGVSVLESCNNFIDFEVVNDQVGRWRYTGIYGYPERRRREEAWSMLQNLAARSSLPWCVIGDFNDMVVDGEKRGGRRHPRSLLQGFSDTIMDCRLIDLGFDGEKYTWERGRGTDNWVQERLDRGLANSAWTDLFPNAVVKVMEASTSDHLPLFLDLNRKVYVHKGKRFRFENVWIKEKECYSLINSCWRSEELGSIVEKMSKCCLVLEEWGGGLVKEMREQLKACRLQMRKFRSRRDVQGIKEYNSARGEFLKLLEKQEIFWQQRAKQYWLTEGDQNSRFFHRYAANRRRNNNIKGLEDSNGNWKEENEDVQSIITEYFSTLFKSSVVDGRLSVEESIASVSEEQNANLLLPFRDEEIKTAVFSMHPDKSPGPDGFNPAFFQTYWEIVGRDVVNFCKSFFATGELPNGINSTLVCLIPKVKQPRQVNELRPISLCNVLMRILSKVMTNRLKPCIKSLVSDKQSAFIEGRMLTDNALIAYEVNHYIRRKTQGKYGVAGLKVDISKAYDRLEWSFIENMLEKFGFNQVWINRIMVCVKSVSYSFLQNGEVFGDIVPQRGIRQGDPISPYLYILCAEGLSAIMRRHEEGGMIHGCTIARGAPSISHLLFADDCYLFFRASEMEACTMKSILQRYEMISGQAVNFRKSNITFSPNTGVEDRLKVCASLEVQEINNPGKYLGMPMSVGRNKGEVFSFLIDRVGQKVQGWSNVTLSKGGKLILLKTAAQAIPNFLMNLFLIPAQVCDAIEKKMNGFWWGQGANSRGIRWMAWDKLCVPKDGGGLGVKCLKSFNKAMLAKQCWRIVNEENPLVSKILKARYFPKTDFLNAELGGSPSYMWRSIMSAQEMFRAGCRRRIGDGTSTRVWQIPWLPSHENGCLTTPMLYELQDIQVEGLMDTENDKWDQDILNDLFNVRDRELINQVPIPIRKRRDSWFWLLDDKGKFTVKSMYRKVQGECDLTFSSFWKKLWSLKIPGKVVNFLWRVCRGCLPTMLALASKQVDVSTVCPWCHSANENDVHVLFECDFARTVWMMEDLQSTVARMHNESCFDIISRVFQTATREKCALIGMVLWSLWNRRNKWVWEHVNGSAFGVKAAAINLLMDWKRAREAELVKVKNQTAAVKRQWSNPPTGWKKINIDAALFSDGFIGTGAVIRNDAGQFIRAKCGRMRGSWKPREAEALSLREALLWARELGLDQCIFESDCKSLVDACNGGTGASYFHTIVLDCIELCKHFNNVLIQFVCRSANSVAHVLATHSLSDLRE